MAQILTKELQMIFQTSDVGICNSNMKDPIVKSNFHIEIYVQALPFSVAVDNIRNI